MAKRSGISVDFSGVESGGRAVPDDEYLFEVVSGEEKESSNGNPMIVWKFKVVEGPYKGATVYDNMTLTPNALWRFKMFLECLGVDVPNGKLEIKIESYLKKRFMAVIANETYQGKQKPRIAEFLRGGSSAGTSETKAPSAGKAFKKGTKVKFEFEGDELEGAVTNIEGDKIIVTTDIDGKTEEWELTPSELTPV